MATKTSSQKIGLGNSFLNRARWIFFLLLFFVFNITVAAVYVGAHTGDLEERVVKPLASFWEDFQASLEEDSTELEPLDTPATPSSSTTRSEVHVEINTTGSSGSTNTEVFKYTYPTATPWPTATPYVYSGPSYEERVEQMQQEADKRWEEALERQAELRAENEAKMEAFSELNEKCGKEFLENKGEYVSDECKNR